MRSHIRSVSISMPTIPVSNFLTVIVLWLHHFALSISGFCKNSFFVLSPIRLGCLFVFWRISRPPSPLKTPLSEHFGGVKPSQQECSDT